MFVNKLDIRLGNNGKRMMIRQSSEEPEINLEFKNKTMGMMNEFTFLLNEIEEKIEKFKRNNDGTQDLELKKDILLSFEKSKYITKRIQNFIELIEKDLNEKLKESNDPNYEDSKLRIYGFLQNVLKQKFKLSIKKMNELQSTLTDEHVKKLGRTLKIYDPNLMEYEIGKLAKSPDELKKFKAERVDKNDPISEKTIEIDERINEMNEVEKSMKTLLETIVKLREILQEQNSILDSIAETTSNIQDHVNKTNRELVTATSYELEANEVF